MNKKIIEIENPTIDIAKGFYSNGIHCGLKNSNKLDLGIVLTEIPAKVYAVYTRNKIKGAPLSVCKKHLKDNIAQLLIVNSKYANTCTGKQGIDDAIETCKKSAEVFNISEYNVLPMSTGVIGEALPLEKIKNGIKKLITIIMDKNENNFAKSIMTTDTYHKIKGVNIKIKDKTCSIIGVAKGSGMIHPNMATLLSFIFTDVSISKNLLKKAFKNSIKKSFNSISIDGDTSTNDTVMIFANGMAENNKIKDIKSSEYKTFYEAVKHIAVSLAKEIVKDGEGVTKLIEINVKNAQSKKDAKKVCNAVAKSSLVKTAFYGEDANWGRILCAIGYSGANIKPENISLYFGGKLICENSSKTDFSEEEIKKILKQDKISVDIDLNYGKYNWTVWTSDLTEDYIKINADYRT